jgi:hypothetical protein
VEQGDYYGSAQHPEEKIRCEPSQGRSALSQLVLKSKLADFPEKSHLIKKLDQRLWTCCPSPVLLK